MKCSLTIVSLCAAIALSAMMSFAQPDSLWSRTFGGGMSDECQSVQQTSDGGYVLAGYTYSFGNNENFWLVKTNANGDSLWSRAFGGADDDEAYAVQQTSDSGYIIAGSTWSFGNGSSDVWLVKTNANGDSLWSRTFGGNIGDGCYSVHQTSDGYTLAGFTYSFSTSGQFWLVKTDVNGDSLWSRMYGRGDDEICYSAQQTSGGGYILAGKTWASFEHVYDFWLVKTNASGDSLWSRAYGGVNHETCYSVWQTSDGGYILGGSAQSYGAGGTDFWVVKTDSSGDSLWSRTFGGSDDEECRSVRPTMDGGYILAGKTWSFGNQTGDFWLVKIDADGDSLWSLTFGGHNEDECSAVLQSEDGGYVLGGTTRSLGAGNSDFWLVRTGPEPSAAEPFILHPSSFTLSTFPNPFNATTTIAYDLPRAGHISLRVFDVLGREVAVVSDGFVEAGSHRAMFEGSAMASGIYFVRLNAGEFSRTKKMMLLK